MSTGIIDAWMQHPTPRIIAHEMFDSLRRWMRKEQSLQELPLEMTIAAMDAAGVAKGLICAWVGPEGDLISNDEVAGFVARFPDRLVGVASVDIRKPVAAVRELRRGVEELGLRALRVLPWLWETPPDDRRMYPLYTACVELGIPFCLQVGHTGPLRPSEFGRPIPYLDRVALDFPDLVIVGGHIGWPWTNEMIALATKYPNVYIDTSAYKTSRYPAELVQYMRGHGSKKVLFGSNFPMMQPAAALADLETLQLSAAQAEDFLFRNAAKVFNLDAPGSLA